MKGIAAALVIAVILGAVYYLGLWVGRKANRVAQAELKSLQDLRYWLIRSAAEHQALGDDYATIVGAKLDEHFQKGIKS